MSDLVMQKARRRYEFEEKKKKLRDTPATLPPKISFQTTSAASGALKNVDMYVPGIWADMSQGRGTSINTNCLCKGI